MSGVEFQVGGASPDAPPDATDTGNGHVGGSLLDDLRSAAQAQAEEHFAEFPVGGEFKKQLWIRYKPMDPGPMNRFISRRAAMKENPKADIPVTEMNMDLMAQSCVCVLGADVNGENREVLEDGHGPVKLEHRLLVVLGMVPAEPMTDSHEAIMLLFGRNAMAIVDHGDDVVKWMTDPTAQPSVGNS